MYQRNGVVVLSHQSIKREVNLIQIITGGICVMNALLKVLCLVMNQRLQAFLTKNNIIDRAQIGFMPKSRTTDHTFTLKTLCNKYVKDKNCGKLFACFIDFKKAYDSIWHEGLFHKLTRALGLPSRQAEFNGNDRLTLMRIVIIRQ